MKGIKYIVLLVMLLSTTSCEKFLEKNPHDFYMIQINYMLPKKDWNLRWQQFMIG